ncbi:hypothetical protein QP618_30685, partial [Klebsiella pneumoniae]|nr:hypothetical protein [Klebsiella pneumoniae]
HGDVLMWLMKTLLTSRCINQRGAGQQRYIERIQRSAKSDWAIFNLYAVGFSHASISKITGVGVQTSKNTVSKIKKELSFDDRDYIIMSSIYTLSYGKFISNVVSILKDGVNFLLNQKYHRYF